MIRPELVHPGAAARGLRAVRRPGKSLRGSRSCGPLAADDSRGQAKRGPRSERHHGRGESDYDGPVPPRLRGREP